MGGKKKLITKYHGCRYVGSNHSLSQPSFHVVVKMRGSSTTVRGSILKDPKIASNFKLFWCIKRKLRGSIVKDPNLHRGITNELKFHIERPGSERKKANTSDTGNRTKKATSKRFPEQHAKQKTSPTIQKLLEVAYDGFSLDEYCSSLRPSA